jgi:N-acetylmuramic acid 6-phosphate (MurNAc-6-P) etherase
MAVVNQYKFYGKTVTAAETNTLLSAGAAETYIIKSIRVTNKSGSNTPTITIKNNAFEIVNTQSLTAATSVEILTLPLILEGSTTLTATTAGTVTDGVVIGISYLNINKEITT